MSDSFVYIVIAGIVLVLILVFALRKPKKEEKTKPSKAAVAEKKKDEKTGTTEDEEEEAEQDQTILISPGTSGALYIPPEMLGDSRNEKVRKKVDETIRNFDWDADGGRSEFLYTLQLTKSGWICPCCEGENENGSPVCMICGKRFGV